MYGNCVAKDLNKDYQFVSNIVGAEFADMIREQYRMVKMVNASGDLFLHDNPDLLSEHAYRTDAIRIQNFNLIVKEIRKKKVRGSVAEVEVFRGEFAQYINRAFSDRTLYLFDTFEGFSDDEAKDELESGNCTELFVEVFKDTSLEEVLKRMKYKDKIVIKKGLFPESLDGLEDTFAFVSIDVDFEQSIYDCIDYFYPRMNEGGYIYIHDYNSPLKGVENAVTNYEEAHKMILHKVPICDSCGTLVIVK